MGMIEHKPSGDPYTLAGIWHFNDSQSEFVASATWREYRNETTAHGGGANHLRLVKIEYAESDSMEDLRQWAVLKVSEGSDGAVIHRTWIDRTGRRENGFVERVTGESVHG